MTLAQVMAEYVRFTTRLNEGRSPFPLRMTLRQAYEVYHRPAVRQRQRSWKTTEGRLEKHVLSILGDRLLSSITLAELEDVIDRMDDASPATKNRVIAAIRSMWSSYERQGLIDHNPARQLRMLPGERARQRVLQVDELGRLGPVLSANDTPASALVQLGLHTGCRLGELLNARCAHVNLEAGSLTLPMTKNGRSRIVPLSPAALSIARKLMRQTHNDYLFPARRGQGPMSRPTRSFDRFLKDAGITGLTFHDLRRTHGSISVQMPGVTVLDVSRALGHSSCQVTERAYLVSVDARIRNATESASRAVHALLFQPAETAQARKEGTA